MTSYSEGLLQATIDAAMQVLDSDALSPYSAPEVKLSLVRAILPASLTDPDDPPF